MKVYQIVEWKTLQISNITNLINIAISNNQSPLVGWAGQNSIAISRITEIINALTVGRKAEMSATKCELIKSKLLTAFSYASIKYLTKFDDEVLEAKFTEIGNFIPSGEYPANDFRNISVDYHGLPELTLSDFIFTIVPYTDPETNITTYTYTVNQNSSITTLSSDLTINLPNAELTAWTTLPTLTAPQDKILYLIFNSPKMKAYDPPLTAKSVILDTMHLREFITVSPFKTDLLDILPELA